MVITRRLFFRAFALSLTPLHITRTLAAEGEQTPDQWMTEWLRTKSDKKPLHGSLVVQRLPGSVYVLLHPIQWLPRPNQKMRTVVVPKGFVSDFASVPRIFWSLFRPDGDYAYAAVIHDYLYWLQDRPKAEADEVFRSAMDDLSIKDWQATALFEAVSKFGGSAWADNKKLKINGERRILKRIPNDPAISWDKWKREPGVF